VRRGVEEDTLTKENNVETMSQMPIVVAAIEYSLIYLLLGGGFFGAAVIYFVAKGLRK
jgi:hypothetical protein